MLVAYGLGFISCFLAVPTCMGGYIIYGISQRGRRIRISFDMTVSRSELKWSIISESEGPSDGITLQFVSLELSLQAHSLNLYSKLAC